VRAFQDMAERAFPPISTMTTLNLLLPDFTFSSRHRAQAYTFNSLTNLTITQARPILDGQQLLWTEQSDPQNHDSIVRPRAAASAEFQRCSGLDLAGTFARRCHDCTGSGMCLGGKECMPYRCCLGGVCCAALRA